jgi:hypothetical protein
LLGGNYNLPTRLSNFDECLRNIKQCKRSPYEVNKQRFVLSASNLGSIKDVSVKHKRKQLICAQQVQRAWARLYQQPG